MTLDVDQILRAHTEAAAATEPAPDSWDRLVARLSEDPPVGPGRRASDGDRIADGRRRGAGGPGRGRWALAAAAAVLAVVAVSAGIALTRGSGEGRGTTTATAPDTETAPETTDPGVGRPCIDETTMPDRVLAVVDHDGDGLADLVRLEEIGVRGTEPGQSVVLAPDATILVPGSEVRPASITSVDVGPDGTAYFAVGEEVWRVDPTSDLVSGPVAAGTAPAVSGDGLTLATIVGGTIRVHAIVDLEAQPRFDLGPGAGETTAIALSPDGTLLARQRITRAADGTVAATAVDVAALDVMGGGEPTGPVEWTEVERSSGVALPAFMAGGHLAVGLGSSGASAGHDEARASDVGMADLATGGVRWSVGGGGFSFTSFDASPDGRWVMVSDDGIVRAFAAVDGWLWDNGTVVASTGMVDAAW